MDVLLPLFQLMYFILHFMYSLFQAVLNCCFELRSYMRQQLWPRTYYYPELLTLVKDYSPLRKIPRHIAFLLAPSQIQHCRHIGHAVTWGIHYGVRYFTLYDYHGKLKQSENFTSIINVILSIHSHINLKVLIDGIEVNLKTLNSHGKAPSWEKGYDIFPNDCNSFIVTLNIFSNEDGKEQLVSVAKEIIWQPNFTIDSSNVGSIIVANDQPDPELAIVVGKPLMTGGLLPWHIRLTEFVSMPSTSLLDYKSFKSLMKTYAKCDQRFGS